MELAIKDITELRREIDNLKEIESRQVSAIKRRFNSPASIFSTAASLFASEKDNGVQHNNLFNKDLVAMISRVILPLTLNKTIFRKSNFITKFLVNIASQRASSLINQKSVSGIWDKLKSLIPKKSVPVVKKQSPPLLPVHQTAVIDIGPDPFDTRID